MLWNYLSSTRNLITSLLIVYRLCLNLVERIVSRYVYRLCLTIRLNVSYLRFDAYIVIVGVYHGKDSV